jgi:hypothetical protein
VEGGLASSLARCRIESRHNGAVDLDATQIKQRLKLFLAALVSTSCWTRCSSTIQFGTLLETERVSKVSLASSELSDVARSLALKQRIWCYVRELLHPSMTPDSNGGGFECIEAGKYQSILHTTKNSMCVDGYWHLQPFLIQVSRCSSSKMVRNRGC